MAKSWCVAMALALSCAAALAGELTPGGIVVGPEGTTATADPVLRGRVVADATRAFSYTGWLTDSSGNTPVTVNGRVTGTLRSRVVLADDGTYDFYWQVSVDSTSFLPIATFTVSGLIPATYDANWRSDSRGSVVPAYVAQQDNGDVTWAFGRYVPPSTLIYPGQSTYLVFLDSDATAYGSASLTLVSEDDMGGNTQVQWGGTSGPYDTFGPADGAGSPVRRGGAPAALAARYVRSDPFLRQLAPRVRGCIVAHIAQQQARHAAYGPAGGPYDEPAIRAAARSFASSCQ